MGRGLNSFDMKRRREQRRKNKDKDRARKKRGPSFHIETKPKYKIDYDEYT